MVNYEYERDCLVILKHLQENGYSGLKELEEATGVSKDECRRYMLPVVKEKRDKDKLLEWRDKNPELYVKILETAKYDENTGRFIINTSKHRVFLKTAHKHDFVLINREEYPGFEVVEESQDTKVEPSELYEAEDIDQTDRFDIPEESWVPLIDKLRQS